MEGFSVEIYLRKTKWLLCCSYNPSRCKIDFHLEKLNRSVALYSSQYENFIILGDFNVEANDSVVLVFSNTYDVKSHKPSCIDLILTNKPQSFQRSCVIETGLSDFDRMTVSVIKTFFEKLQPRVVNFCDKFRTDLLSEFGKANRSTQGAIIRLL